MVEANPDDGWGEDNDMDQDGWDEWDEAEVEVNCDFD